MTGKIASAAVAASFLFSLSAHPADNGGFGDRKSGPTLKATQAACEKLVKEWGENRKFSSTKDTDKISCAELRDGNEIIGHVATYMFGQKPGEPPPKTRWVSIPLAAGCNRIANNYKDEFDRPGFAGCQAVNDEKPVGIVGRFAIRPVTTKKPD